MGSKVGRKLIILGAAIVAARTVAADELRVGVAGPLSGPLAALGEQLKRGAEQFVSDQNGKGGVLGRRLTLQEADDQCDPRQAVAVANQLATQQVAVVIGHACSGSSIPASDVYSDAGIIEISPSSTNPQFTERGHKNVFRTIGRDDQQGTFGGRYVAEHFKGGNVAIAHDKSAYGRGLAEEAKAALIGAGVRPVLEEAVSAGDKDFSAFVTKLKASHVDVLYYGGYHPEAGLIVRQSADHGVKLQLVGGDALDTIDFAAIAGTAGDGTLFSFAPDARNLPSARTVTAEFSEAGYDPEGYTLYTYAAFQAWAEAAIKAKSFKSGDVATALRRDTFKTVIGDLQFDDNGDLKGPRFEMYRWRCDTSPARYVPVQ
jgi:branched-chain amino acid transport system substrate-binding protein